MSNFAEVKNGIVIRVIIADQDFIDSGKVGDSINWIETSSEIRKHYTGIGYKYDKIKDQFVTPAPYSDWILDENNDWVSPKTKPTLDEQLFNIFWNEENHEWVTEVRKNAKISPN